MSHSLSADKKPAEQEEFNKQLYYMNLAKEIMPVFTVIGNVDSNCKLPYIGGSLLSKAGYTPADYIRFKRKDFKGLIYEPDIEPRFNIIKAALASGKKTYDVQYRIICRDGTVLWAKESAVVTTDYEGNQAVLSTVTDITAQKNAEEQLRILLEEYKVVIRQSGKSVVMYNLKDNSFSAYIQGKEINMPKNTEKNLRFPLEHGIISADSSEDYLQFVESIENGVAEGQTEIKVRIPEFDNYRWFHANYSLINGIDKKPEIAVISFYDIHDRKSLENHYKRWKAAALTDNVTGIYNRGATIRGIEKVLDSSSDGAKFALFMVDIDNFKIINDSYGHVKGDEALVNVAKALFDCFSGDDVYGRVGGDEFMAFISFTEMDEVRQKAAELKKALHISVEEVELTPSIGVVITGGEETFFENLYRLADHAMYTAKNSGKNRYCIIESQSGRIIN